MMMRIIYLYENFVHPSNESVNDDFLVCFDLKFLCHKEANLFTFEALANLCHFCVFFFPVFSFFFGEHFCVFFLVHWISVIIPYIFNFLSRRKKAQFFLPFCLPLEPKVLSPLT